ncbi:LysR family transcriptional regulator [Streptomyces sp. So13.3]|uniref:LysR family transcriptional regulator n=1 Tax=unclassified Streptomyces TaxID=2593676 RepID=UPI00110622CE|nr:MULTISPECIES: LysR family transcriptional regulator [unclassified Streptomyces]MCZ4099363.1 LysR family transcriptional regulator [Streptomyces sp. H39-C1]QNA70845.1 LysR family transcriptional regulator [Streptomyces sp. So13.3]
MIDTRRLRTLRAVADHRTLTAAAAALYLTPSAVSQQLAALEQEVGHQLLVRDGRGVRLTAAGEILAAHGNTVLAQLERAEAELAAYAAGHAGEVTVASFATGIATVVAPAMTELGTSHPGIRLRVRDAEGDASLTMVLDGHADLAVAVEYRGAPREDDERLSRVPLYAEPFDAVLPRSHRLADSASVRVADLAEEPWIGPYPGNPCHEVVMLACEFAGFQPRVTHSSDDFRAVAALAGAGAGVALVPRSALRGVDLPEVVVLPVAGDPPTRRVFAAVRRGAEQHPLVRPVLDALAMAADRARPREDPAELLGLNG